MMYTMHIAPANAKRPGAFFPVCLRLGAGLFWLRDWLKRELSGDYQLQGRRHYRRGRSGKVRYRETPCARGPCPAKSDCTRNLAPLAVDVKVKDFASICPFTLAPGASLLLRSDKADVKVGGYLDVDHA